MKFGNKFILANFKSNVQSLDEAELLLQKGLELGDKVAHYAVCSPFIYPLFQKYSPIIGAQSVSQYESGSHTGMYTAEQIKNAGATFTLLGHSEERARGASDESINKAIANSLKQNLYPCLCIGEKNRENSEGEIQIQIDKCLENLNKEMTENKIMLAYEPIWAIGSEAKRSASESEIIETITFIKKYINQKFDLLENNNINVLYGGSVDSKNIEQILNLDVCNGVLLGRSSSDLTEWYKIVDILK